MHWGGVCEAGVKVGPGSRHIIHIVAKVQKHCKAAQAADRVQTGVSQVFADKVQKNASEI
jgi:hypothetical protein